MKSARLAASALAAACLGVVAGPSYGIVWNGNRPDLGVTSAGGLNDRPGIFNNTHVIFNTNNNTRGTATYLADNWVITARHVVQDFDYNHLSYAGGIYFDIGGERHYGDRYQEIPYLADMILVHVGGGDITSLPAFHRDVIYDGFNDGNRLVQQGGYGGHGYFDENPNFSVEFHRGFNVSYANGDGFVRTYIDGEGRLRDLGLLEVGAISGDSGSPLLLLDAPDSQVFDQSKYKIAGILGTSGGSGVYSESSYTRTDSFSGLIRDTVWGGAVVDYTYRAGSGEFVSNANWAASKGGFDFAEQAHILNINNGATVTFSGGSNGGNPFNIAQSSIVPAELWVGESGTGTLNITGNTLGAGKYFVAGRGNGTGTINLSGGRANANIFIAGAFADGRGAINVSGGGFASAADEVRVGEFGRGVMNVSGSGGAETRALYVGRSANGTGAVRQSGGTVRIGTVNGVGTNADSRIGGFDTLDTNAYGTYDLSGGTLSVTSNLQIGAYGVGSMTVNGSTVNAAAYPSVGRFATGRGVLNVSAGTFNRTGGGGLIIGEQGTGALNLTGGAVRNDGEVSVGLAAGSSGAVNFNGGELRTTRLRGGAGTSRLSFNGGTLTAAADETNFLGGLSSAVVNAGGATVNTDGHNVTIAQALAAPTGSGVASISASGGSNYLGAPLVRLAGGGGTGATGVATINPATGAITGVSITNPGVGYTSAPTVELIGGGGSGATVGAATLAANASGGLTKTGGGTLTLSGANSYRGATVVAGGTLALAAPQTLAGAFTVRPGAAARFAANVGVGPITVDGGSAALASGRFAVRTTGFTLTGGRFDLADGTLVDDYAGGTPARTFRAMLAANALYSGLSASRPGFTVGYAEASALGTLPAYLAGVGPTDSTTLLATYALGGDANLDGRVNNADFQSFLAHFGQSDQLWTSGDFNYDGRVDAGDFRLLLADYGRTSDGGSLGLSSAPLLAFAAANGLSTSVPEPSAIALIGLGGMALLRRRR